MDRLTVTDMRVVPGDSGFLLDDGTTAVLYDTGFGFTGFAMAEKIRGYLGQRKLDYIFLTHSHYDHALGSAYILQSYPEAKVVAGHYAAQVFPRPGAQAVMRRLDNAVAAQNGVREYPFLAQQLRVDISVGEGDIVQAGNWRFEVLELPGHTKCSVGFFCRELGLLLSSETLGVFDGADKVIPSYLVGYQMTLDSIDKVLRLPVQQILAPHMGLLTREQTAMFLKNMKPAAIDTAQRICRMLAEGSSEEEILQWFLDTYCDEAIRAIYPVDAARLNTSIMIGLIQREC